MPIERQRQSVHAQRNATLGELKKLNHQVVRSTIVKTLKEHGIRPGPERPTSWRTFLRTHADAIAVADFFTTEVWTARGPVTHYVLFVIDHATRTVEIAGITNNPGSAFMAQVARNLTDHLDGFLRSKRFLIVDRMRSSPSTSATYCTRPAWRSCAPATRPRT